MSQARKERCCTYCGAPNPQTSDHVPPKLLWASPRPSNLITVPACKRCNLGASDDDEYFRLVVALRDDVYYHSEVQKLIPTIFSSLTKSQKKGFARGFFEKTFKANEVTPGGLILGARTGYHVDLTRLERVAQRTVRGLHFHELGTPIPKDYEVRVFFESGLEDIDQAAREQLTALSTRIVNSGNAKSITDVFSYWWAKVEDMESATAWILQFYGKNSAIAFSGPADSLRKHPSAIILP